MADPLPIAIHGDQTLDLLPGLANRHGLITGATGTGKTVTLQVMAERLSSIGVPIFMADVKGDLAGLSQPGQSFPELEDARRRKAQVPGISGHLLGPLRRAGTSRARHRVRHGTAAAVAHPEPQRDA